MACRPSPSASRPPAASEGDEFEYSDLIATDFGTEHHQIRIDAARMLAGLDGAIGAMSEPMVSHDCVAFYLLSQEVTQHVNVVQSGQGADEVFAGYHWYPPLARRAASGARAGALRRGVLRPRRRRMDAPAAAAVAARRRRRARLRPAALAPARCGHRPGRGLRLDTKVMLVDDPVKRVDNMTMAWGLEARVPFLDHELVELAARCPPELKLADGGKGVLKEAAAHGHPDEVIDRPKGYFPVPAIIHLEGPYLDLVRDALHSAAGPRPRAVPPPTSTRCWPTPTATHTAGETSCGSSGCWSSGSARHVDGQAVVMAARTPVRAVVQDLGWGGWFSARLRRPRAARLRPARRGQRPPRHLHVPRRAARPRRPAPAGVLHRPVLHLPADADEPRAYQPPAVTGTVGAPGERHRGLRAINQLYPHCRMVPADVDLMWDNSQHQAAHRYLVATDDEHRTRSSAPSPASTTPSSSATRRTDPACGAWRSAPTLSRPGVGGLWCARWPRTSCAAAAPRWTCRCCTTTRRHRALRADGLHPRPGAGHQAQERDQRTAVHIRHVRKRTGATQPLRPDHRRRGDARGIPVEVPDAKWGELRLTHGGTSLVTRESLSELTNAVAMSRCDDKRVTRRVVAEAGIARARRAHREVTHEDHEFLAEVGSVVVKPARGEQGAGITVGVTPPRRPRPRPRAGAPALPRGAGRGALRGRGPAHRRHRRQGGRRRRCGARPRWSAAATTPSASSSRRRAGGVRPPPTASPHPARRRHHGHRARGRLGTGRRPARQRAAGRAAHREPAHRRHHPRRHRRAEPQTGEGGGRRGRRDRHPGDRARPDGARGDGERVRLHRGQRAAGPGQSRTAADGTGIRRPAVSPHRRHPVGMAARPSGAAVTGLAEDGSHAGGRPRLDGRHAAGAAADTESVGAHRRGDAIDRRYPATTSVCRSR